uniref:ABC transmembrane type-2 domain-containing protein n=1 Tax=Helminthora furcellata TaxID=1884666 RepID=A0A1G4NZG4_9FLOR|nr:Hypothetical protein ycf38 [Helminthora furcellata]SCW21210.1 Hypothetical protein ycf38 [Helminthora furcellata]SCW24070.1 Hypothetical protein ycf38 [Helminthora furcellata]
MYKQSQNNTKREYYVLQPDFSKRDLTNKFPSYIQEIHALTIRLLKQSLRRPSLIVTGIIQPLLWLTLFGALFQNAPIQLFTYGQKYGDFVSSGIIVFTAFTSALNSGLPMMFDREFGFFNRILSSSIYSRYSIIIASSINIMLSSCIQILFIIFTIYMLGYSINKTPNYMIITIILFLLSNSVTSISLVLAFILPGHIELLACIVMLNLPLLFSSTALAPLVFMPSWLQIIASLNPLTYAIETIRYTYLNILILPDSTIITTIWGDINFKDIILILLSTNAAVILLSHQLIAHKFED